MYDIDSPLLNSPLLRNRESSLSRSGINMYVTSSSSKHEKKANSFDRQLIIMMDISLVLLQSMVISNTV